MNQTPKTGKLLVICRADRKPDGTKGDYEIASSQVFDTYCEALRYSDGVSSSREPLIVFVVGGG